jgi:hypothetical protein
MKRILLAAFLGAALALGGCQTFKGLGAATNAISYATSVKADSNGVAALRYGMKLAVDFATAYVALDPCRPGEHFSFTKGTVCSEDVAVYALKTAKDNAQQADVALQSFLERHPDQLGVSGVFDAAQTALKQLGDVLTQYHVPGAPA